MKQNNTLSFPIPVRGTCSEFNLLGHSKTRFRVIAWKVKKYQCNVDFRKPPKHPSLFSSTAPSFPISISFPQFSSLLISFSINSKIQKAQTTKGALFSIYSTKNIFFLLPFSNLKLKVSSPKFAPRFLSQAFPPNPKTDFFFFFNHLSQANVRAVVFQFWIPTCAKILPPILHPKIRKTISDYSQTQQGLLSPLNARKGRHRPPHFIKTVPLTVVSLVRSLGQLESRWSIHARH